MTHEDFLFGAYSREVPVVTDAYKQPSSVGIGKCRYRLGQLACIRHTIFEILLLMFALADEALKIAFIVHLDAKIRKSLEVWKLLLNFAAVVTN